MKRAILPLLVGMVCFSLAMIAIVYGGQLTSWAQVSASDLLMVRADGPRFGSRPIRDDIVLVLFDQPSAVQLGYVHSYSDDIALYRKLIRSNVKVVFDTRMIAAATDDAFSEIRPMLDEMLDIAGDGRLLRDVWLSTDMQQSTAGRYANLLTQNVINSHPHAVPSLGSRLYPLIYFDMAGPHESAPLVICRKAWGLNLADQMLLGEELRRSGIMSAWHEVEPLIVPKTEVPKSNYGIGPYHIAWNIFQTTSKLVPPVGFWVSYDPPITDYARHSYVDVLHGAESQDFEDKIVIVGYSADIDPSSDTYAIPSLLGKASAAEVVAAATQTILDQRNMRPPGLPVSAMILGLLALGLALVTGLLKPVQATVFAVTTLLLYYALAIFAYRFGWYSDFVIAPFFASLAGIGGGIVNAWHSLRSRQRVVDLFGRYVPRAVVNQLIQRSEMESLLMNGVKRDVTVMFADIRGFTNFSQDMAPEEVVRQLNTLLKIMVDCTFESEGTLDKFIGDAILVLFNAPIDQPDHGERAVRTAVAIQERLKGHASGLQVGIGVHRGEAVIGNIGTPQRMEYTAIGSTVNIASRLCDVAQPGEVVVSQAVFANQSPATETGSRDVVTVKGIQNPIQVVRITC